MMSLFGTSEKEPRHDQMAEQAPLENGRDIPTAEALAQAQEGLKKRGRGRPKGSGSKSTSGPSPEDAAHQTRVMLDKLFDPKLWGPLIAMPADSMLALTGHEHWNLSQVERDTLGATASTAAQYLGIENPKTLAVSLLLVNLAMVYAPRAIKEFSIMKAERDKNGKENRLGT